MLDEDSANRYIFNMKNIYYHRAIEPLILKSLKHFPAILITGPRQAGKSTLLKESLKTYRYANLDDPVMRSLAKKDPRLFMDANRPPVIIDEIQYAPELLSYIKMEIDAHRDLAGQFALTGSQVFPMMQGVSETLAGRIAIFHLYPLQVDEMPKIRLKNGGRQVSGLAEQIIRGFYPELIVNINIDWNRWFASYIATYLERDVRNIKKIGDLVKFQSFISLLAARAGGLLNLSEVSKECGVTQPTAKEWLAILQSTYIVYILQPWHRNITKRVVKTSKLYFVDTGLLCYLLGIDNADRFMKSAERGKIFENFVVMEALKRVSALERRVNMFFYRTAAGVETDLLLEIGDGIRACEIKFSKTPDPAMASGLKHSAQDLFYSSGAVLTIQDEPVPLSEKIISMNWHEGLAKILEP